LKKLCFDTAVVLFSGGQDSTTCLYYAKKNYKKIYALTFDYGQRHKIELSAAKEIAKFAGVEHTQLEISGFKQLGGSSLTSPNIPVSSELSPANNLPTTFVPGRNIIFLTYAAAFAYQNNAGVLVTGICQTDFSGYPDCRIETMNSLEETLRYGLDADFKIVTPLMYLSKAETVKLAEKFGALEALSLSHTCYNGQKPPCQNCPACLLRARGFQEAGIPDPLLVP
jgi:7-cyano-7-deazaguanine synthase